MNKIIGIKELQTKTKQIRLEVEKGVHFTVVWRSKPIFEIHPFTQVEFHDDLKSTGLYTKTFLKQMEEAEDDLRKGRTKTYKNTQEFLKSL